MRERPSRRSQPSGHLVDPPSGGAGGVSRRAVLRAGTFGAAAVGVMGAFPGLLGELPSVGPEASAGASEATAGASEAEIMTASDLEGPVVAHIRDAATGEISLYVGEREIVYRDFALVQKLTRAAR